MSVDKTSYLLYGFKVEDRGKLKILENMYDDLMETPPCSNIFNSTQSDQTIVWDVMCGKYVYVGILLLSFLLGKIRLTRTVKIVLPVICLLLSHNLTLLQDVPLLSNFVFMVEGYLSGYWYETEVSMGTVIFNFFKASAWYAGLGLCILNAFLRFLLGFRCSFIRLCILTAFLKTLASSYVYLVFASLFTDLTYPLHICMYP